MVTNPNLFSYFFVHFDRMFYKVHFWNLVRWCNTMDGDDKGLERGKNVNCISSPLVLFFFALVVSIFKRFSSMCRSMGLISREIIDNGLTLALFCVGFDKFLYTTSLLFLWWRCFIKECDPCFFWCIASKWLDFILFLAFGS